MTTEVKKHRGKGAAAFFAIIGIILIVLGIIPVAGGAAILFYNRYRDSQGYHLSNIYQINTSTYAFMMEMSPLRIESVLGRLSQSLFGTENTIQAEWVVTPVNSSKAVFAGWAPYNAGQNYVSQTETEGPYPEWHWSGPYAPKITITGTLIFGQGASGPTASPATQTFWLDAAHSSSTFDLHFNPVWDSTQGNNYLIITNMDGSQGVAANIALGFKIPIFNWLGYVLIPVGIIIFACGILLVRKKK
jgi:hypothetical protein